MLSIFHSSHLNKVRKNLAAYPERSPLMRSYDYASAGDHPGFAYREIAGGAPSGEHPGGRATHGAVAEKARFPLSFVPFMQ